MTRHDYIVDTLVKLGFRTSLRGFDQFCVEFYSDNRTTTMDNMYKFISAKFACSRSAIEKNLVRLFSCSDACTNIGKLFGIEIAVGCSKEIIATFSNYVCLHRDCYDEDYSLFSTAYRLGSSDRFGSRI